MTLAAIPTVTACTAAKSPFQALGHIQNSIPITRTSISRKHLPFLAFNSRSSVIFKSAAATRSTDNYVWKLRTLQCKATRRNSDGSTGFFNEREEQGIYLRKLTQTVLWVAEGVYILWLFLLPYAPGDPVWAISPETMNYLVGLSLNFFFVLPLLNVAGIHAIDAPVLHPMSEGLFNFVIGWTFMFGPLLFTDNKRDRYKGSLEILYGLQMFLTNTFLIPYMAIRLNDGENSLTSCQRSQFSSVMVKGAPIVGLLGGIVCLVSALWGLFGRAESNFGSLLDRWEFLVSFLGSERLAYAFIWDIVLYTIFQPWLIGENLDNVEESRVNLVRYLRFVPVIGLIAYLLFLDVKDEEVTL